MRSLTFSVRRCCSVSLLVSSFAAAKLHHIAGRSLHRPPASTAGLVSQVRAFGTYSRFSFSFVSPPPFVGNPWPDFDRYGRRWSDALLSSRTTTSLRSKLAPRQQPVACWLWTQMFIFWTLSPIWFLSVPRRCCFRCVWCNVDMCPLSVIWILLNRALLYKLYFHLLCHSCRCCDTCILYITLVSCAPCVYVVKCTGRWSTQV